MYLHAATLMPIKPLSILFYPGGDVPLERGVCTDVVLRAYRQPGPDRNVDHRRVPNPGTYFARHGTSLPPSKEAHACRAGDIVTWRLPRKLIHIGIVSGRQAWSGVPLIIHNIGEGAREENILFSYPITGHYRWQPR